MQTPHDKFFKKSISRKETAQGFLEHYLPQDLLTKIDLTTLKIDKDSFTNNDLEEYFSDTVYKAKLAGKESYLCFLFEHKSYPYFDITLQLLKYMLRIWKLKREQGVEKLPLIVPMLIYHGRNKWDIGLKLSDIIEEVPFEAKEYLPDFKYILFDLSNYSKEEIKGTGQMRVFVDVLSAVFQDDFEEKLYDAIKVLKQLEKQNKALNYFQTVVKYIMEADVIDASLSDVKEIANRVSKQKGEEVMSIAEKLREEGMEEGIEKGQGLGMAKLIEKQLFNKFKSIPEEYKEKLEKQDQEKLEVIGTKILEMDNIEELEEYLN